MHPYSPSPVCLHVVSYPSCYSEDTAQLHDHKCTESRKQKDKRSRDENKEDYPRVTSSVPSFLYLFYPVPKAEQLTQTTAQPCLLLCSLSKRQSTPTPGASLRERSIWSQKEKPFLWSAPCQDSQTVQESTISWKLTGCSWAFLNGSEKSGRELGWLNSELGFSKGCKVTILPIFHFFDFIACKAAQEGYTVTDLPRWCQDESNQNFCSKC